jgi:hypothetical protein
MSDWQPARLRKFHAGKRNYVAPIPKEKRDAALRKVVRIRERPVAGNVESDYRGFGCDAERFYEINPEDLGCKLDTVVMVCEHEILTD